MIGNSLDSNDCAHLAALEDKTGKIQDLWRVAMYRLSNIAPGLIAAFGLATPAIAADSTQSVEDEIRRLEMMEMEITTGVSSSGSRLAVGRGKRRK